MTDFFHIGGELEIRAEEKRRRLRGRFPYSPGPGRRMATVRDRGRVRKERIAPDAFGWQLAEFDRVQTELARVIEASVDDARAELLRQELERRNVHILAGHSYDRPLGDLRSGTARVTSDREAVEFILDLPEHESDMPSWMVDVLRQVRAGLAGGVSPGFRVPPAGTVLRSAETLEPDPAAPGVQVRVIQHAVLYELSVVTRPAYSDTELDARAFDPAPGGPRRRSVWL